MHLVNNKTTAKKEVIIMMNVFKKFAEAYNENKVAVICGMAMMNGNTNVYPLYEAMTDESK
jgi:plastocyanin domain-containing protein